MSDQQKRLPKIDKNPMRQITNNSKSKPNKLASRLYRNSSLNHINPNISMLSSSEVEPSLLNASSNMSTNQLIASISLRKLKKKFENQPYLQITNGKLLLNRNTSEFQDCSPKDLKNQKRMFKKLQKLNYSPMNRILPDDLIDFPIQKQENQIKKCSLSPARSKNRFTESKDDLLPEDFIQLLQEEKNITNQFCYLKKMDHPYDLKIIQFDKNLQKKSENAPVEYPSEYITISSRGVTYFSEDQSRFVTLDEWKKQANYFKKIIKLDFFKNFKVIKNFSNWKKYLRKSAMKSTIQKLKEKLVFNDKFLRKSLLNIRDICYVMQSDVSYCRLDDCQKVANFREFKAAQQVFIQNQFERRIFQLEENIKQVLMQNMAESMKQFKQENKISSSIQGKGMPLLIGDQKNLEMPYTKEATLRTQQQKFQKFVKLVDILITHSKVNMMVESTNFLSKKIDEENENYEKQVVQSNYKNNFKGKQYLQCILTLDPSEPGLFLRPTKEDLISLFQDIVNRSVVRLCRNHKKISSDIDVLSIIYDNQQQFPKQSESENLKAIMTSDGRQQEMLRLIMNSVSVSYQHVLNYVERFKQLAKINFENVQRMDEIETFQPKDYQIIKNLIQKWQKYKQIIGQLSKEHEGPLFQVNLKQFKEKTQKTTNTCISKAKQVVPVIFEQSIKQLQKSLKSALVHLQQQPHGIESLMIFNQHKNRISADIDDYSDRMMEITCLQILLRNINPSNSQSSGYKKYEKQIKQLQSSLNTLRRKIDEADFNNKRYETRAQQQVKEMIPKNKAKLDELYTKIQIICREQKPTREIMSFIQKKRAELSQIVKQFNDIRTYQRFLNLVEEDTTIINSFSQFFSVFQKIWSTANQYNIFNDELQEKCCGLIKAPQLYSKLQEFITIMVGLQKQIKLTKQKDMIFQFSNHDSSIIKLVLQKIQSIRPIIETIQCLNNPTLGQKQWKEIRLNLQSRNQNLLKILQIDKNQRKTKELVKANASTQLQFLKGIVSKAKKNNQIVQKFQSVRNFTNFSKQHLGLFRNLTEKFKNHISQFLGMLDQKLIMTNFILEQTEQNQNQRAKSQKNTLEKLKQILLLWDQYEQHVQYFQPIYSLMDWKNYQEAKLFIAATDQNWKKTYKSFKDSNLSKILSAERIIPSLKQSNQILESLYPSMKSYFDSKRFQSTRLYFLSDSQIVKIHSQSKDFKGFNNYINKLYPTIKQLSIKQDEILPHEVINLEGQALPIKLGRVSNYEVQEMLKVVDQGIKNGIKAAIKNCFVGYESQQFNKIAWFKQNPLQILIFVSAVYFTRIIEQDYLLKDQYTDIQKLETYHLSQIQNLRKMLIQQKKQILTQKKLMVLLTQAINIRDIISHLGSVNVRSRQSYEWLKQIRSYHVNQQSYNEYLAIKVSYGNQFVCMTANPLLALNQHQRYVVQIINNIFLCNNLPIVKNSLMLELSIYNAKPYNKVCITSGEHINMIQHAIEGTWLTGSFVDLQLLQNVSIDQLKVITKTIQQVQQAINSKESYFHGFKNIVLHPESGICLVSPYLIESSMLKHCNFDYRVVTPQQIPWNAYMDLLFQIYGIESPNLGKKLGKTISYLQKSLPDLRISRKDVKNWVKQLSGQAENQLSISKGFIKKINRKQYPNSKRKFINKVFHDIFGVFSGQHIQSYKSIRDFSVSQQEINKISSILKQSKVCILAGQNSQFKDNIVSDVSKQFRLQNSKIKSFIVTSHNFASLLGYYKDGKWMAGLLHQSVKSTHNQKQCFILIGEPNKAMLSLLETINSSQSQDNYVNLQNGQKFYLTSQQKIIYVTQSEGANTIFGKTAIKINDFNKIKSVPEEIFSYLMRQKKDPIFDQTIEVRHFQNKIEALVSLQNIFLNNLQKISSSNLKMIGYKSQNIEINLIMNRFAILINTALQADKQRHCIQNIKMMEKLYIWCLFWSIGSCLPKINIERLDKLFDSIKIQFDKSQSLSQSKFAISQRNLSVFKFIKSEKIFQNQLKDYFIVNQELQAKAQLIKMLVVQNNHIMLIGEKNSGKTSYITYLQNVLQTNGYGVVTTKINRKTTLRQFLSCLKNKLYYQYFPYSQEVKYKACTINGKKLIIFVDNFNLIELNSQLFNFFETCSSYGYYYDTNRHCKVKLGDICFICSKNGAFEAINNSYSFILRKFFPISINGIQLSEIMSIYSQGLENLTETKRQLLKKILPSISSLHTFATNLMSSQKYKIERSIYYNAPIWIAKQLIRYAENEESLPNDLISLWRYLTVKKYIQSGVLATFDQEIQHQLSNLIALIVKSSTQSENYLRKQIQLVNIIKQREPLLQLCQDPTQYYVFLAYLLKSSQLKHVVTHSCKTPKFFKVQALASICKELKINFSTVQSQKQLQILRYKENIVLYVGQCSTQLMEKVFSVLIEQSLNSQLTFVIDVANKQQFDQFLRFYPSIQNLVHVYDVPPNSYNNQSKIQNYQMISDMLLRSGLQKQYMQYQQMFWMIKKQMKQVQPKLAQLINSKTCFYKSIIDNFKLLQNDILALKQQMQNITQQIVGLQQKQDEFLQKKNKLVEQLTKIKAKQNMNQSALNEKESINKSIYLLDCQIKKIKSQKNQKVQLISKSKQNSKEKIEIFEVLKEIRHKIQINHKICQCLVKNQRNMQLFMVIYSIFQIYYYSKQNKNYLDQLIQVCQEYSTNQLGFEICTIYSALLGTAIEDVKKDQCIIKHLLSNQASIFVTNNPQKLIQKLLLASPDCRVCSTQYEVSQNITLRPIICKEFSNWGSSKVTIVTKQVPQAYQKICTRIQFNQQSDFQNEFEKQLTQQILSLNKQVLSSDSVFLHSQKSRLQAELKQLVNKLTDKLCIDKTQFGTTNHISQIKQINDALQAVQNRIQNNQQKCGLIKSKIVEKYGEIIEKCKEYRLYVQSIKKMFPYANLNDKHLIEIILLSFVFKLISKQKANNQNQAQQQAKEKEAVLQINDTCKKIKSKIFSWVNMNLAPKDSVTSYFLLACFSMREENLMSMQEISLIINILQDKQGNLKRQPYISIQREICLIINNIIKNRQNKLQSMLEFAENRLNFGFRNLLSGREEFITYISSLFKHKINEPQSHRKDRKIFFLLGSLQFNSYKIIDKQIRKYTNMEQSVIYFSDASYIDQKIEALDKIPHSQQGWVIFSGLNKAQRINQLIKYINKQKNYRAVFLFDTIEELVGCKNRMGNQQYYQLCLNDKTTNICYQIMRILKRYNVDTHSEQINKIMKMIGCQHVSRLFKGLSDPTYKHTSYAYRLIQSVLQRIGNIRALDVISLAFDHYFKPTESKNRVFVKECLRQLNKESIKLNSEQASKNLQVKEWAKANKIPQVNDDGSVSELYVPFMQSYETLKFKIDKQQKLKQFIKTFFPQLVWRQITTDGLLGYPDYSNNDQSYIQIIFNKQNTLNKINEILQKAPILSKQQEAQRISPYHIQILKGQKKSLESRYMIEMEKIRKLERIMSSKRMLSAQTQKILVHITKRSDQIIGQLLEIYRKITQIQKQIQSKQKINLCACLQLLSKPQQFLYVYMFEVQNLGKVDWTKFGIEIKCITEKEKDLLKQAIQRNQFVQLTGLRVNNAKFQMHKCSLESYSPGEFSKLSNSLICVGKQDSQVPYTRSIPFIINGTKVADFSIASKMKEPGFWGIPVTITFVERQQQILEENKKK